MTAPTFAVLLLFAGTIPDDHVAPSSLNEQAVSPLAEPAPQSTPAALDSAIPEAIVVTGRRDRADDPVRALNGASFAVGQVADRAIIGPLAMTYREVLPRPVRTGLRNFLYNLREPIVFVNYLLQLKPGKAAETAGRFLVNSTVGVAGFVDVARRRPFRLPRRRNGFADTLGYYGIGPGPFLFVPLVGPTTVRDLLGDAVDRLLLPLAVGRPFDRRAFTLPTNILRTLDHRAEFDEQLHALRDDNPRAYTALRDYYLDRRRAEIERLHHRRPAPPPVTPAAGAPR